MAQSKKLNENFLAKIIKELNAIAEFIRTKQDEKQAVMDDFGLERKRYLAGKISEKTLESSVRKVNKELITLDKQIRDRITKLNKKCYMAMRISMNQAPKVFRATLSGIKSASVKKKAVKKKKTVKKKSAKRGKKVVSKSLLKKELSLDKRYS